MLVRKPLANARGSDQSRDREGALLVRKYISRSRYWRRRAALPRGVQTANSPKRLCRRRARRELLDDVDEDAVDSVLIPYKVSENRRGNVIEYVVRIQVIGEIQRVDSDAEPMIPKPPREPGSLKSR